MAARISKVSVDSVRALDAATTHCAAHGFVVVNKTAQSVTLVKKKEFRRS